MVVQAAKVQLPAQRHSDRTQISPYTIRLQTNTAGSRLLPCNARGSRRGADSPKFLEVLHNLATFQDTIEVRLRLQGASPEVSFLVSWRQLLILSLIGSLFANGSLAVAQSAQPVTASAAAPSANKLPPPRKRPQYIIEEPKADTTPKQTPAEPERTRLPRPASEAGNAANDKVPLAPDFANRNSASAIPAPSPTPMPVPMPAVEAPPPSRPRDKFPTVGQLESLMFGHSSPQIAVEGRLERLESSVFQKSFPDLDTEARIRRLKEVLVGEAEHPQAATAGPYGANPASQSAGTYGAGSTGGYSAAPASQPLQGRGYSQNPKPVQEEAQRPFFNNYDHLNLSQELDVPQLEKFGLLVINEARADQGLEPLSWDDRAANVAKELVEDLSKRGVVSHSNTKGENPDVRFSRSGGSQAMDEGLIMFTSASQLHSNRELVVKMLQAISERQDDRDELLSRHATHFAMSFRWTPDRSRLICATEVITAHGEMESLPLTARVGEKIDVKGTLDGQYRFMKITVAREDEMTPLPDDGEESAEALPYFPPLDYTCYARKSEQNWDKGIRILQIAGITAAIAGGFFIPPVALAAPLIAISAGAPAVKPVSEIPVRGGVKTDGVNFSHKVPLDDNGRPGIYYITVWAQVGTSTDPVAVSRRAIIAHRPASDTGIGESTGEPISHSDEDQTAGRKGDRAKKRTKDSSSK